MLGGLADIGSDPTRPFTSPILAQGAPAFWHSVLLKNGFDPKLLRDPNAFKAAMHAHKQGIKGASFNASYRKGGAAGVYTHGIAAPTPGVIPHGGNIYSVVKPKDKAPAKAGHGGRGATDPLAEIMALAQGLGGMMPQGGNLNLPAPPNYGKLLKGLKAPGMSDKDIIDLINSQYAPDIANMNTEIAAQGLQGNQNLADIQGWYGQLQGAVNNATAGDTAAAQAGRASYDNSVNSFLQAVGGGASPAAGDIANAGAAGAAGLAGIGAAQGNFDRNLNPLYSAAEADALRRTQGQNSQDALKLTMQLNDLKGSQRADTIKQLFAGREDRYKNAMDVLKMKVDLTQQGWTNAMKVAEMNLSAHQAADPLKLIDEAAKLYKIANPGSTKAPKTRAQKYSEALTIKGKQLDILGKEQRLQKGAGGGGLKQSDLSSISSGLDNATQFKDAAGHMQRITDPTSFVKTVTAYLVQRGLNPYSGAGRRLRLAYLSRFFTLNPKTGLPVDAIGHLSSHNA